MMKKLLSLFLVISIVFTISLAFAQDETEYEPVIVFDETSTQEFAKLYMEGESFDRLYSMFDEIKVMHVPKTYFSNQLSAIKDITGEFVEFGDYQMIDNGETHTFVQNIIMENKDVVMMLTMGAPYYSDKQGEDFSLIHGLLFTMTDKNKISQEKNIVTEIANYNETEISIGDDEWKVEATMLVPQLESGEKCPAVVLVQGSGPLDRDEKVGVVKPMKDIAEALASNGIASIRYDKRTYTYPTKFTAEILRDFTVKEEIIDDTIYAAEALVQNEFIDSNNVFIIGHSLGAMTAPRIMNENKGVFKGAVLISGSPYSLLDIIRFQNMDALGNLKNEELSAALNVVMPEFDKADNLTNMDVEEAKNTLLFNQPAYYFYDMEMNRCESFVDDLNEPMLIIQGNADFQVSTANGIKAWEKLFIDKDNIVFNKYNGLNHLMMKYELEKNKGTVLEYSVPANVDKTVIKDITLWIKQTSVVEGD